MTVGVPRAWKVVLVVEDDSDGRACRLLLRTKHPQVVLDWVPANGIGNIKRKGAAFIRLARSRITSNNGCVAVLLDRDGSDLKSEPHVTIARICSNEGVPLLLAREAMEAWFLADSSICKWLGLRPQKNTEAIQKPKQVIADAFLKKTKRAYDKRRTREEVARQATGPDESRNHSLALALAHLFTCLTSLQDATDTTEV